MKNPPFESVSSHVQVRVVLLGGAEMTVALRRCLDRQYWNEELFCDGPKAALFQP